MKEDLELEEVDYEEYDPHAILVNGRNWEPLTIDFAKKEFLELIEEKNNSLLYDTLIWLDDEWNSIVIPYQQMLFEN